MNKIHIKKKNKNTRKYLTTVDPNKCTKISMGMGFIKANVLGSLVGILTAVLAWSITIPFVGIARYQILDTFLIEKVYKIGVKLTEIAQKLNIVQTLSYEQALTQTPFPASL
jgi:hypothetical protein